jgi:hypothetical protein
LVVICAVALLSATIATAHSGVADQHMGEAAAMCLAVVVGGAVVAALPSLGARHSFRRAALELGAPNAPFRLTSPPRHHARGDPAVLQVFRR